MKAEREDHRTRVSRAMIRTALLQLLQQKPKSSISITELCETAKINRGTFYKYYKDVDDLLWQIEREMMEEFQTAIQPVLEAEATARTPRDIIAEVFCCVERNLDLCIVTLSEYGDKDFLLHLLQLGKEKCLYAYKSHLEGLSPEYVEWFYAFISNGCIGILRQWLEDGRKVPTEKLALFADALIREGMQSLQAMQSPVGGQKKRGKNCVL